MTESEQYVADAIRTWVWSGFYSAEDISEMLQDIVEEDCDVEMLNALIPTEIGHKAEAEQSWPAVTDCDRLNKVFWELHDAGICALENAGYTMSDGYSEVAEAVAAAPAGHYNGYCFYHGQDMEHAINGGGLMIAFGDLQDDPVRGLAVGKQVAAALQAAGFDVVWDTTIETRIDLPSFDWKRRSR